MALTATGMAHERRCRQPCEHWISSFGEQQRRGCTWAWFCGYSGPDPAGWLELSRDFLNGPDTGCPAGYWAGLAPVDLAAESAAQDDATAETIANRLAPVVWRLIQKDVPLATLQDRLHRAVTDGIIPALVATKLEGKVRTALGI